MDISDLTYAMDKLNLYRAGQLGQLQSPQAMELYRQMYGAATSKPVQQVAKQAAQKGLGALGKLGSSIINPATGLITTGLLYSGGVIDEDRKRWDRMEQKLRDAGLNSQEEFDAIYPTLDTRTRGFAGRMFPEYYQNYINRL